MVIESVATERGHVVLHHFGGNGPTLLLNHATGFHARCYLPMLPVLREHFTVFGADFAGHGDSPAPPDGDFAWNKFADDLLRVVDHLGDDSVFAFGHSMGGASTLLAEAARPGTFTAMWLYEPIIFPTGFANRNAMMAEGARKRRSQFDSQAEALVRYASRPPLGLLRADALAAYVAHGFHALDPAHPDGRVELACAPESEAATFENAQTSVEDVATVTAPVTVAFGDADTAPGPAQFAPPLAHALANAHLARYEHLVHFGPMQAPDQIANDVVAFLTTLPK